MRSTLRHPTLHSPSSSTALKPPFICLRCRSHASRLPPPLTRHYATDSDPSSASFSSSNRPNSKFVERTRQRIWGTEHPPGQRDPYKPLTPEERARDEELRAKEIQKEADRDVVEEAEAEYVPATSGEGLERIGGASGWWEEEWDRENVYRGFLTERKITHSESAVTVRRVLIELLALQEEGRPLSDSSKASLDRNGHFSYAGIDVVVEDDGKAQLSYKDPALRSWLMESLEPEEGLEEENDNRTALAESEAEADPEELQKEERPNIATVVQSGNHAGGNETVAEATSVPIEENVSQKDSESGEDTEAITAEVEENMSLQTQQILAKEAQVAEQESSWLEVPLDDLDFKFAFVKRLMSLSGIRIPDPKINEFSKVGDVVAHLSEKPKPKKLVDMLLADSQLMALPNVEVFERRHTPIDKEKEVGRWKLIEAELLKRGLPVTGHRVN